MLRTALVVEVSEPASIVDGWRKRTCADKPSIGVPAHVTLLFPFVPAERLDDRLLAELDALFARFDPFAVVFAQTDRFPTTLYLRPEPAQPFVGLTEAIVARYPEHPPYEGAFDEIVPHLTVAHGEPELLGVPRGGRRADPPLRVVVDEVVLLEEVEPDWRPWARRRAFGHRRSQRLGSRQEFTTETRQHPTRPTPRLRTYRATA